MKADHLIEAWLDDELDQSRQADLEQLLHDPSQAEQLVRAAHFRHALRSLVARQGRSDALRNARPIGSRRLVWRLGLAACLCVGLGIWLSVARLSPRTDRPSAHGRYLASGEIVEAAASPIELRWRDGTHIALAPNSSLRIASDPGNGLELLHGSLHAMIAKQPAEAGLEISANGCATTTADGDFTLAIAPAAIRLSVTQGAVRLVRRQDGFRATVDAGGLCIVPQQGLPHVLPSGFAITPLDDAVGSMSRSAQGGAADAYRLTTEPGLSEATAARVTGTYASIPMLEVDRYAKSWILLRLAPRQGTWDLSSRDGIEFWFRGPGTAARSRIWVELVCYDQSVLAPDHETHFVTYVPDSAPGWRLVRLRWSDFIMREWPDRPAGTRLLSASVMQVNVMQLGVRDPDFAVDGLAAWSAP